MCGRYTLTDPGDLLAELGVEPAKPVKARYNVAPTQTMPAVRAGRDGGRELTELRWGLVPFWAKDPKIGNRMINARSETVAQKPAFRNALRQRRCLVPADGFYEWRKMPGGKQPYHIFLKNHRPFVFAGLWERWDKGEDGPLETYVLLTTRPNDKIAELHDRMPVILPREAWDAWLDLELGDADKLTGLLGPYDPDEMDFAPVSRLVNSPSNDVPQCIEPLRTLAS